MASAPSLAEQAQVRPSFAKVAAAAIKPQPPRDVVPKPRPPVATPRLPMPKARTIVSGGTHASKSSASQSAAKILEHSPAEPPKQVGQDMQPVEASALIPSVLKTDNRDQAQPPATVKLSVAEDGSTQLSSSDGSAKPPSIDGGKSVASATTFALDEKESLRPDDSASLRAVEEEDVTSPPDSIVADSRQGSDHGAARAFRDQLHEIAVIQPQIHRGVPPGRFPNMPNGPHTLFDPVQMLSGARPVSQPVANVMLPGPSSIPVIPDEKLLEALQSPRDRLFVVKIEQDFIDFIKDSRESEYSLPNCNTFYRMLAHRLADYYGLGHVVDGTMTGVKITRTPYCRIPPPVSQMVDPTKGSSTPPVELPTRKIMRRDDSKSGTNTAANSQTASKTTSEIGGSDGSNDGNEGKDKAALTREEREARYREARQRIFGSAENEESETGETTGSGEDREKDNDLSRTNSAAGKKKNMKKLRNYDDDDFQARSHFNAYYPQQYAGPGYSAENVVYYNGYAGSMSTPQYAAMNPGVSPPSTYSNPYPGMVPADSQSHYGWGGQQYQPSNGSMMYSGYSQAQNGYDVSADFQRGMPSFPNPGMQSQITPKMANPPMAAYQDPYQQNQHMPMNSSWPQMPHQPAYQPGQAPYAPAGSSNGPMSYPQQIPAASPYAQFPASPYNGKANRNQHPLPGSYTRPQFNPQTQSFIPNTSNYYNVNMHGNLPFRGQSSAAPPQMNGHGGFPQPYPQHMPPSQGAQYHSSSNSTQSFGSPQSMPGNNTGHHMNRIASQSGDQGSSQSSIAKYGTPSHLPPKPPAPAPSQQSAPKFMLPTMSRDPSDMSAGHVNTAQ
ncbi:hypothetical protein ACN47E_003647 [Coniothyrium glycines]